MKRNSKSPVLLPGAVAGLLLLAATQLGVAGMYQLADLGVLNGEAAAINNAGQIVGWTYNTSYYTDFAAFWTNCNSPPVNLSVGPDFYPCENQAAAINSSGQIVGLELDYNFSYFGGFWNNSRSEGESLGAGTFYAQAYGINDSGQIVGVAELVYRMPHAA